MHNIVTVTCNRDLEQFLVQARSLQYLKSPVTHWVIVNESSLESWASVLEPYYTVHTLKLIPRPFSVFDNDGWLSQQAYKLWIWQLINDSYIVLDSKNFFLQPCELFAFNAIHGCGQLEDYSSKAHWLATIRYYSEYFNVEYSSIQLCMQAPFVIEDSVMRSVDWSTVMPMFCSVNPLPSEFLLYSILCKRVGYTGELRSMHHTLYGRSRDSFPPAQWADCLVGGVHRDYLARHGLSVCNLNNVC